jgi:glutamyl-tRNA reductase
MAQRASVPLIQSLNRQADDWQAESLSRARRLLARGADIESVLDGLARGLTAKLLHGAMAELHGADEPHRAAAEAAIARLFLRSGLR